jgi:hypothetical protein
MEATAAVVVVMLALGIIAVIRYLSDSEAQAKRALSRRSRSEIVGSQGGEIRITGRVQARGELLRAPVSGRSCVAYQLEVEVEEGENWKTVIDTSAARAFLVNDATGEARVELDGPVVLALERDRRGATGFFDDIDEAARLSVERLLESKGVSLKLWLGMRRNFRYKEGVLEEGEIVSIGGVAVREVDERAQPVAPRSLPTALVLRGTVDSPLLISDAPESHGRVS